jgi:hypothetical protein
MTASDKTIEVINKALKHIKKLPHGTYFNFNYAGDLQIEARTQTEVKEIRRAFGRIVWKKEFVEWRQSWTYKGTTRTGLEVVICGVTEGPPACKMVEETVMEEREVPAAPITYVKQMVEVKKVRYICPDGDKVKS